jgi:hypothetical protein
MVKMPISEQDVIPPDLTKTPKVILAGFIRTGTVSMSIAMQILLKGAVCHSGSVRIFLKSSFLQLVCHNFLYVQGS